jgi:p-aminobenzoyl-glutamate transporter AbgT
MAGGGFGIMMIIIAIITVAVGSAVGLAMVSQTGTTFLSLNASDEAETAFNSTTDIIYNSWPLLGLVVLGLIGAAVLSAITLFR